MNNPNVNQRGQVTIDDGRQVIVPNARFNCNGRITNVAASMKWSFAINYPLFQVWHPITTSTYSKIGEAQLSDGSLKGVGQGSYYYVNMSLNSNSQIEFQSGDVIGYYQPFNARQIWNIQTSDYTSYSYTAYTATAPNVLLNISSEGIIKTNYQPLIKVMFGKVITVCMYGCHYGKFHNLIQLLLLSYYVSCYN